MGLRDGFTPGSCREPSTDHLPRTPLRPDEGATRTRRSLLLRKGAQPVSRASAYDGYGSCDRHSVNSMNWRRGSASLRLQRTGEFPDHAVLNIEPVQFPLRLRIQD